MKFIAWAVMYKPKGQQPATLECLTVGAVVNSETPHLHQHLVTSDSQRGSEHRGNCTWPSREPVGDAAGSRRTWGKRCLTSFRLFNSNALFGRARTPGAVRKPVFELNTTEEAQESGLRGRGGGITCLPFLQEALGLARTNSLMSPKLVLHVLIAQGFEVRGQSPVELQDSLIQGSDTRNVRARHRAARPVAPAQNGPRLCPFRKKTRDLHPVWSLIESRPSGSPNFGAHRKASCPSLLEAWLLSSHCNFLIESLEWRYQVQSLEWVRCLNFQS